MNSKGLSSVVGAIILIAVFVVFAVAIAVWVGSISASFLWFEKEPVLDIYDPDNSTLREAYDNCIGELERRNYTLYEAQFKMEVWLKAECFNDFLDLLENYNKTIVFHDSPKGRGWFGMNPSQAFIWFNDELPDKSIITIYYFLED